MSYRNSEKRKQYCQKYKTKHKKETTKYNKEYYLKYKEQEKIRQKEYYLEHKEERQKWGREYSYRNRKRRNELVCYRKKVDIKFRLNHTLSTAILKALKDKKAGRRWEKLVGYTVDDLKKHLEKQFTKKINWSNYGFYWHIDHIKPKSLFHYNSVKNKEFKECWSLKNLQPLEAIENIKKSNHYFA